ncbi:hypothetical protein GTA08_BOTSDO09653 [Botryosphaeria dothidea]|uniref:Uncharacterized protein n=1 Tax=Botryosphaeria dothidea TaxID=55169 RepID=A0A8H4IJE0_9PEZI|nr:hypothetical protein GTA08_BOTSDO09653 [Botryosphaeria dothidea]
MHFSTPTTTLLTALLAITTATASPITANDNSSNDLVRRSNSCTNTFYVLAAKWDVYLDNDASYNKQCGGGCLDNIRGRCGVVTDWGCERNGGTAHMHFSTGSGCTNYDMTQALKACTKGQQTINCSTNK